MGMWRKLLSESRTLKTKPAVLKEDDVVVAELPPVEEVPPAPEEPVVEPTDEFVPDYSSIVAAIKGILTDESMDSEQKLTAISGAIDAAETPPAEGGEEAPIEEPPVESVKTVPVVPTPAAEPKKEAAVVSVESKKEEIKKS